MRAGTGDQVIKSIQRLAGPFSQVEVIRGEWRRKTLEWGIKARLAESAEPKFGARFSHLATFLSGLLPTNV
jgi:hypothetical protein